MAIEVALEATPSGPDSEFNLQGYASLYVRVAQDTSRGREHLRESLSIIKQPITPSSID